MLIVAWSFWVSLAACVWVYAGYPALLAVLARLCPRPIRTGACHPPITVVIPVYNGAHVIERKIHAMLANGYPADLIEVVVASDGSTDGTDGIVQRIDDPSVRLLSLPRRGKAAALNAAAAVATGEILVFTDADVELDRDALTRLTSNFADPEVGAVTGRKALAGTEGATDVGRGEGLYLRIDEWQKQQESLIGSTVAAHGALHAIRRALWSPIRDERAADDMSISMPVVLKGYRLIHEPRAVAFVSPPANPRDEFARKVRIVNQSLRALFGLGSALWRSGFYSVTLISHKLLRYAVPLFLMIMLATSGRLALEGHRGWWLVVLAQAAFYTAAAAALVTGGASGRRTVRLLTVPFYFCVVNAAALVGLVSLVLGRGSATWSPGAGFQRRPTPSRGERSAPRAVSQTPVVP